MYRPVFCTHCVRILVWWSLLYKLSFVKISAELMNENSLSQFLFVSHFNVVIFYLMNFIFFFFFNNKHEVINLNSNLNSFIMSHFIAVCMYNRQLKSQHRKWFQKPIKICICYIRWVMSVVMFWKTQYPLTYLYTLTSVFCSAYIFNAASVCVVRVCVWIRMRKSAK